MYSRCTKLNPCKLLQSSLFSSYLKESATEKEVARGFEEVEVTAQRLVGQLVQVAAQHHHVARISRGRQVLREAPRAPTLQVERGLPNKYLFV